MAVSTEFADTDPRALELLLSLERKLTPGRKIELVFELSQFLFDLAAAGIRRDHPGAGELEVRRRLAARLLDRELVIRAYGWDPHSDADNPSGA